MKTELLFRIVILAVFIAVTLVVVLWTLKARVVTGAEGMIGKIGKVATALAPEGKVLVRGELWTATARDGASIEPGAKVRVVTINGMELTVERIS